MEKPYAPHSEAAQVLSIVIPAHNEASVIDRCLNAFLAAGVLPAFDVVVAANGCSDATAERAGAFPGVRVLDLPGAGKAAALNAADGVARGFPRVYLDADIVVTASCLEALGRALRNDRPLVAAPTARFIVAGRPWAVRAFYRVYTQLPYVSVGLIGSGIYALSAAGRARFDRFPPATADDLFVQRLFAPGERVVLAEHTFDIQTPRTLRGLIAVRTRTAFGNAELAASDATAELDVDRSGSTGSTVHALGRLLLREPRLLPSAVVYLVITLIARLRASRRSQASWDRDSSTR